MNIIKCKLCMEMMLSPQNMNKSDLDHHSVWCKLGINFSESVVKSSVYNGAIIEWE